MRPNSSALLSRNMSAAVQLPSHLTGWCHGSLMPTPQTNALGNHNTGSISTTTSRPSHIHTTARMQLLPRQQLAGLQRLLSTGKRLIAPQLNCQPLQQHLNSIAVASWGSSSCKSQLPPLLVPCASKWIAARSVVARSIAASAGETESIAAVKRLVGPFSSSTSL